MLEAVQATPGDVFVFWHSMLQAINNVLRDKNQDFPSAVQNDINGILNRRDSQMFVDGNLSSDSEVFLAGAYLDPSA